MTGGRAFSKGNCKERKLYLRCASPARAQRRRRARLLSDSFDCRGNDAVCNNQRVTTQNQ